ncbi:helix-turn-helix domain-containing protein [uncultured Mitsuokella sp.]|uniref:helix-turn-helix domain-containing protein n=1 Tax=uncultured Mitsuokella sp. TaxID=453120 RepID=UPI00260737F5|nr:helix-turn-helix domain-containing protein [uncultured Mitsuokella sp.]
MHKENYHGFLTVYHRTSTKKGQHLTFADRVVIQTRLRDKWSIRRIARELGCAPNTVRNEMERGKVLLEGRRRLGYRAIVGQETYEAARKHCGRHRRALECGSFLDYVEQMFYEKHWFLDACFGHALRSHKFPRQKMVCTKTLYNYVTLGLLGPIKRNCRSA